MSLIFEWDPQKAESNLRKHGISFDEASSAFADVFSITIQDPLHSETEDRFILLGHSCKARLVVVVHIERGDRIRIISARRATFSERSTYEKNEK